MKAIIGKKLGMTQIFDGDGNILPATVIEAGPCVVTQVKTRQSDGYNAVQLGFGKAKKAKRPQMGHLKAANTCSRVLREFDLAPAEGDESEEVKVGHQLDVSVFEVGDRVKISGTSKGKGFAGTIKRHNFTTGPKTHGSHNYRAPGSIGSGYPEHVFKGIRMAGRMGGQQATTSGLEVVLVDNEQNLLAVRGAVPGPNRGIVTVRG